MSGGRPRSRVGALVLRFARSRAAELVSGLLLMATGILEIVDSELERGIGVEVGIHHGAIFYGFLQAARGVAAFLSNEVDAVLRLAEASAEPARPAGPAEDGPAVAGRRADG